LGAVAGAPDRRETQTPRAVGTPEACIIHEWTGLRVEQGFQVKGVP
jgi:hypothetical protein